MKFFRTLALRPITIIVAVLVVVLFELFLIGIEPGPGEKLVVGFIAFVIQVFLTVFIGRAIGTRLGAIILKNNILANAIFKILRLALWAPVFALWATTSPAALSVIAVIAAATYYQIAASLCTTIDHKTSRALTIRDVTLHGVLVCLLAQLFDPSGFSWFAVLPPYGLLKIMLVITFLVAVNHMLISTYDLAFDDSAHAYGQIIKDVYSVRNPPFFQVTFFITVGLVLWQILGSIDFLPIISPIAILKALLVVMQEQGSSVVTGSSALYAMLISFAEISLGLALAVLLAILAYNAFANSPKRDFAVKILPYIHTTPLAFIPLLLEHMSLRGFWLATCSVCLTSFLPYFRAFWGLSSDRSIHRAVMALSITLPYAFLGMLFSETMHSFNGLGFALLTANGPTSSEQPERIVIVTGIILLSILGSSILAKLALSKSVPLKFR